MEITRRGLLGAGAAAGAALLLPLNLKTTANAAAPMGVTPYAESLTPVIAGLSPFTEQLPTLAQMGVIDATKGGSATIRMANSTHSFHANQEGTPTFAYQGGIVEGKAGTQTYLGPVVIAKRNVPFNLTVVNTLGAHPLAKAIDFKIMGTQDLDATAPRAAVHLHGGNTEAASDGDPMDFFGQGAKRTYHYGNTQEAAGLWYHDHALGITRLNVFAGLAGGYLVRDANDTGDGSRLPAPPYEVPLIIQDRMFNDDGSFLYPTGDSRPWTPEFFGDVATVNGKIMPNLDVAQGKYRFRVFNGSNARFYNFRFMAGLSALPFFQIGTDGGLLNWPVLLNQLLLAPGERADLVVDFAQLAKDAKVILTNNANSPFPNGTEEPTLPEIMRFTGTGVRGWTKPLHRLTYLRARTAPITRLAGLKPDVIRTMSLVELHDPISGDPTMVLMNNMNFHHMLDDPMTVRSNALEEWVLINTTVDAHPMHLHFAQFQILDREKLTDKGVTSYLDAAGYTDKDGVDVPNIGTTPPVDPSWLTGVKRPPEANERGWKDTVVALPGEVTRIRIPFGPKAVPIRWLPGYHLPMAIGASHKGDYVSHCHILEHEENDMMMRFKIL